MIDLCCASATTRGCTTVRTWTSHMINFNEGLTTMDVTGIYIVEGLEIPKGKRSAGIRTQYCQADAHDTCMHVNLCIMAPPQVYKEGGRNIQGIFNLYIYCVPHNLMDTKKYLGCTIVTQKLGRMKNSDTIAWCVVAHYYSRKQQHSCLWSSVALFHTQVLCQQVLPGACYMFIVHLN